MSSTEANGLRNVFEIGRDEFVALQEEARRTGHVMSDRAAKFSEVFGDNVERLQKRLEGLKLFIGVQLMPVMNELVVGLTEWFDANRALVVSTLQDWVKRLTGFIRALLDPTSEIRVAFQRFGETLSSIAGFIKPLTDRVGVLNAGLMLVAAWIFGPMLAALVTLGAAVVNLGAVILTTPFGWILAGIAAVVVAVYVLYQRWDEFAAYWSGLWGRIKEAFNQGFILGVITLLKEFNPVTHIARGINAMIEYFTGINLMEHGSRLIQTLTAGISAGAQNIGAFISEAVASAWAAYEEWWNSFSANVRAAGAAVVQALWDGLRSTWGSVVAWFKGAVADLIGWLPESLQKKLGFNVETTVSGPAAANDNAVSAGAAASASAARLIGGVPTGARQDVAAAVANDNAPSTGSGDVNTEILTNSGNNVSTTLNATVNITAPPGADAAAIGAAVRRELDAVNRRAAAASQSALSD